MEDLRFYDYEFNLLCVIPTVIEVMWDIKFNGVGTFEASIIPDSKVTSALMGRDHIVVIQGTKQAIITEKFAEGNKLTLYGRTMNYILTKRVILPFDIKDKNVENKAFKLIEKLVEESFPEIEVEIPQEDEEIEFYRLVMYELEEIICDILDKVNAGHRVYYDIKKEKWILKIAKQKENNILLSEENGNIYNATYREGVLDFANCGVYMRYIRDCGDWDPYLNEPPLSMGQPSNLGKLYRVSCNGNWNFKDYYKGEYIACISEDGEFVKTEYITEYFLKIETEEKGLYKWEAKLSGNSRKEAEKSLKTKDKENKLDAKTANFKFEKDYNLGDIARIQKKVGSRVIDGKRLINGVQIWYGSRNSGEKPMFKEVQI